MRVGAGVGAGVGARVGGMGRVRGSGARVPADDDERVTTEPDPSPAPAGGSVAGPGLDGEPSAIGTGWLIAGALAVVAVLPLLLMGPGTDLDVRAVILSGRSIVGEGGYIVSRAPGAPVHEAAVGVLDLVGGTVATNLGSLVAAVALTLGLAALLRREGVGRVGLSTAVVVANPWFLVAASSTIDFLWALALWVGAALVLRRAPTLAGAAGAGVLAGLAVGSRSSTALLVVGLALAEALEARDARDPEASDGGSPSPSPVARAATLLGVAGAVGALAFLPAFLSNDSSLAFAQNDVPTSSLAVQVGRFLTKDLYFFGPFAAVALLLAAPAVVRCLARWRIDWLVRLGTTTIVVSQLLFLRYPWKMGHLLPTLVGLAMLLARALRDRPGLLTAVVATQALYAVVSIGLIAPDTPNAATGGRLTFDPRWGALVVDVQCRLDDPDAWDAPPAAELPPGSGERSSEERIGAVWDCAKPWAR